MTARLPEGVFVCSKKAVAKADAASVTAAAPVVEEEEKKVGKPKMKASQTFNLKEGVTLTLDSAEVDKEFCDASSDLSLAGYMNVKGSQFDTKSDKNLFYWFFEKRTTSQLPSESKPMLESENGETPLVIWLTGGPGCSSSLALLTENGPCSVEDDGTTTKVNPHSWTESAHVMWLDQPANVGYSYGQENDTNEEMISEDAYYFLQAWFKSDEGKKYKDSPLFIVGESYGGHYAPAIAHRIWRGNNDLKEGLDTLNLKGLAVGNGLTDPEEQYQWYAEMVYNNSHGKQVVSEDTYKMMKKAEPLCTKGIKACNAGENTLSSFACQGAFAYCNTALTTPYRATGLNPYDITKECGDNPLCYDFSHIEKFMNLDSTKKALHVDKHNPSWQTCNMMVNLSFHVDWMKNFAPYVADLLNAGIPALIYAGDIDFVCNYLGNRAWTLKLDWDHKEDFKKADEKDWNNGGGLVRSSNNLTFLQVYDAGHMVPSDQPEQALAMITQFLNGEPF
jgi:cathepsin A (carboxypeptidase C)